jgi:hypothetical protein
MTAKRSVVLFAIALFCSSKGVLAQCTAPADWFPHDHTPMPGTANPGNDHCEFHKWSWQTFLWLTQTVDGELRFIKQMYSSEEPFGLERFKSEVQDWDNRDKSQLVLRPRDAKPAGIRGTPDINQPGDNGILIDQNHHPVYYAMHVNKVYFDFMVKREYFDPAKLAVASSVDRFPVGTLEIKSSWEVVSDGDNTSGRYTTNAVLQPLQCESGKVLVKPHQNVNSAPKQKVTLVGLHVAGVVTGHPEFIWATFELRGNAPLLKQGAPPDSLVTTSGTRFCAANTKVKERNQPNAGHVTIIDVQKQTFDPITQVVRERASGGGTDIPVVQQLNRDVQAQLARTGDIAANYELIGSLWVNDGELEPNQTPGLPDAQSGSTRLANTTMETFRQSVGNCFSCHNTLEYKYNDIFLPPLDLNLSHVLRNVFVRNAQHLKTKAQPNASGPPNK